MAATYRSLDLVRYRLTLARDIVKDPFIVAELDKAIADLDAAIQELLDADRQDEEPKEVVMPERFDFDAFLLDMFNPSRHMAVAVWE